MSFVDKIKRFTNAEILKNEPMNRHTTLKVGGKADYFIKVGSVKDLRTVIELCKEFDINHVVLGNGSNVLVSDSGYNGAVINLCGLSFIKIKEKTATAFAGANLKKFYSVLLKNGFAGFEGLLGIPGSVGGAVVMNAGAFGYSVSDYIKEVSVLYKGEIKRYNAEECGFGYRQSRFLRFDGVIVSATFAYYNGDIKKTKKNIELFYNQRKKTQPLGNSVGSTFKNPNGDYAARLIEGANLKGFTVGGAKVSDKHANFIITNDKATASDVFALINIIEKRVKETYGLNLKREIRLIGEFNDINGRLSYSHDI